ncbi:MAG: tRNA 2-thiouridine(34) synthase MnmA [Pseudomonadota bacterium]
MSSSTTVIVGMSGGVDSSVSAYLLKERGFDVQGLFMTNWEEDEDDYCTAAEDFQDARQVCDDLNIPLHRVNFSGEYRDRVFQYFLDEYQAGRTPNPDVLCNREIKFGVFFEYACRLGADVIATGHYARTRHHEGQHQLLMGKDPDKDQSYFLHSVQESALAKTLFPLGDMHKSEVRDIAHRYGLVTHNKKDSTGICFIGERDFRNFLSQYLPGQPGTIYSLDGDPLGDHQGAMYYTIGQRQGLGIGGNAKYGDEPWYVVEKDVAKNRLIVAQGNDHPRLFSRGLMAEQIHWINGKSLEKTVSCAAKTRYRQSNQDCTVALLEEANLKVSFDQPQRAVTPGQYVALYRDDVCLGGGVIASTFS